ncbi:hypothetical protein [Nevskia sp.]|uniref:hypothetical protein n=1 Tax=Nevskia sp. TaxID=1929292 RepID=UPI0025EC088D|nr:hypothetical protein [Nevskia sp.]
MNDDPTPDWPDLLALCMLALVLTLSYVAEGSETRQAARHPAHDRGLHSTGDLAMNLIATDPPSSDRRP